MQFFSPLVYAWAFVTNSEQYYLSFGCLFFLYTGFITIFRNSSDMCFFWSLILLQIHQRSEQDDEKGASMEIYGFWLIWGLNSTSSHFTMQILNLRDFFLKWKETHKETFWHDEYHLSHIDEARADNCLNKHLSPSAVKFIIIDGCLKLMDIFKTN